MFPSRSLIVLCSVASATVASAQTPLFVTLPTGSHVTDVATDAASGEPVAVGTLSSGDAFRWTPSSGVVALGPVASGSEVNCSYDGSVIAADTVGMDLVTRASLWSGGTSWTQLPGIGGTSGNVATVTDGVSGDGSAVVGLGWVSAGSAHGFRWTQALGSVDLGTTPSGGSSRARGVNADGSFIVGWQDGSGRQGARWVNGVESVFTYTNPSNVTFACGAAQSVNADGTIVVGTQILGGDTSAWRWDAASGAVTLLANLAGETTKASANDVTDDGSIVVGNNGGSFLNSKALIWIQGAVQNYHAYLTSLGVTGLGTYTQLGIATAISRDGRVVGGWGSQLGGAPNGGWVVYVPLPGHAFCFGDGALADHTTPCPCGNSGANGHGCAHSFNAAGAQIGASGVVANDDVILQASSLPVTSFTLFLQHDAAGDTIFHDGTLCAGGTLVRLRGRAAVAGAATFPNNAFAQDSTLTLSQRGGVAPGSGALRYYSAWFRNASSTFCPPATANVTNGYTIVW